MSGCMTARSPAFADSSIAKFGATAGTAVATVLTRCSTKNHVVAVSFSMLQPVAVTAGKHLTGTCLYAKSSLADMYVNDSLGTWSFQTRLATVLNC